MKFYHEKKLDKLEELVHGLRAHVMLKRFLCLFYRNR